MKIIAGLGNPGDPYRLTRHNMGFLVVDALADDCGIAIQKKKFEGVLGGGDRGHKGVRSIMDHLGEGGFTRVRLGIGKPPFKDDTERYVLQPFPKADMEQLADVVRTACEAVREILAAG